jgi:hypothetical protein
MNLRGVSIAALVAACLATSAHSFDPNDDAANAVDAALDAAADALEDAAEAAAAANGETAVPATNEDDELWAPITYYDPLIDEFVADAKSLRGADQGREKAVAGKYGLTVPALRQTIKFQREMERSQYTTNQRAALSGEAWKLVEGNPRAPIILMLAAGAIGHLNKEEYCTAADIDRLMKGSRNHDGDLWAIASSCADSGTLAIVLDRAPNVRPALLYVAMNWTRSDPASDLAATDMLLRPAFLDQVDPAQRATILADVARYKISRLIRVGLNQEAVAFGDRLDDRALGEALKVDRSKLITRIGGVRLKTERFSDSIAVDYAAALAMSGRPEDARSILDGIAPLSKRRAALACLVAADKDCPLGDRNNQVPLGALFVDHFMDTPDADPFIFIEGQTGISSSGIGGAGQLFCKLQLQPDEQAECRSANEVVAAARGEKEDDDSDRALWAAIRKVGGQPFETARATYAAKLATPGSAPSEEKKDWSRESVDPAPVPFRELPLSPAVQAKSPRSGADPEKLASLPKGYYPVRVELNGQKAAAISLSQRLDPNGEVTAGGYWLHLSEDGGKSWQLPLYTGLAEHFPYVVPDKARMPMIAGDHIQLEVEEALIDTASIGYPPVGMRLKRKRKDLYLDIPIADLLKDGDGDGLSDIAARHLLLDQPGNGKTPFVVGQERDCAAPSADTLARLEILKKIFAVEARGLIEPAGERTELLGPWRKSSPSEKPPIFLEGNPDDYRCVALDRPMIIYSEDDRERLRRHSPDFQLIELPPIRWNRDHTRGFVNWSMGWTGGTYRLVRDGNSWKLESISEWIT